MLKEKRRKNFIFDNFDQNLGIKANKISTNFLKSLKQN
jgi:hypothetical protein